MKERRHRPPVNPNGKSVAEIVPARRNPSDYYSRIMKEHQSGGHIQGYNCQAAVDAEVTNQVNDKLLPPKLRNWTLTPTSRRHPKRKTITEPVFGQLKEARRFRTFLLRGTENVRGEWQLRAICLNLAKLHKAKA
jgi:hypothetical protein